MGCTGQVQSRHNQEPDLIFVFEVVGYHNLTYVGWLVGKFYDISWDRNWGLGGPQSDW